MVQCSFDDVLKHIKNQSASKRDQGTAFEKLMRWWLLNDPVQKSRYKHVHTYKTWAKNHHQSGQDAGIDLVAETYDGEFTAVQCKFYDP